MSKETGNNDFASFDEYLRQGEPTQKESAENWKTAIGLQVVDGLHPSTYLIDVARKNIEGKISLDETKKLIDSYYQGKTARTPKDEEEEEADKVSVNIAKILASKTFAFNTNGYVSLHRRIFEGVLKNRYLHIHPTEDWKVQPNLRGTFGNMPKKVDRKSGQKTKEAILQLIASNPSISSVEMAEAIGINRSAISKHLKTLKDNGIVKRIGPDKGGKWNIIKEQ